MRSLALLGQLLNALGVLIALRTHCSARELGLPAQDSTEGHPQTGV